MPDFREYVRQNLPSLGVSPADEAAVVEELSLELEQRYEAATRGGGDPAEALRETLLQFRGQELGMQIRSALHSDSARGDSARGDRPVSRSNLFAGAAADVRCALRSLRKNPAFALAAFLTLALCLGANLTIFAAVDAILIRPLHYPDADRLAIMYNSYPKAGEDRTEASLTNYYERRGQIPAFSSIGALMYGTAVLGEHSGTELTQVARVTSEFFSTLGTAPVLGRAFLDREMTYLTDHEIILSDAYWRSHFGADPHVLGRNVWSDGIPRKVVGVLPRDFRFLSSKAEAYLPFSSEESERNIVARHGGGAVLIGRLKPGATLAQAQAQVDAHNAAHASEFRYAKEIAAAGFHTVVAPLQADHVASVRPTLILVEAGALLLLLIGTVNLAGLLMVRAAGRSKEFAVRLSLGASRVHLFRQTIVESVLLCAGGALLGLAAGTAGIRLLSTLGVDRLPLGARVAFDVRLASIAVSCALVMGVSAGLAIGWLQLRQSAANALRSESRAGTISLTAQRLREGFIVAQIAFAFVLLTGAGMLGLSLKHAMAISPGFRQDHILTGHMNLPWNSYRDQASFVRLADRLTSELSHQPGVTAAGVTTALPFARMNGSDAFTVPGYGPKPGASVILHPIYAVTGRYFTAMGIPLIKGRYLNSADSHSDGQVCVVDENFARRYWPEGNAVGHLIFRGIDRRPGNDLTVVGVVGAVKQAELTEKQESGAVYYPHSRYFARDLFVVARTSLPPELLSATLRTIVRKADPDMAMADLQPMDARIDETLVARRSPAVLAALFAQVALFLTAIGAYGVFAYVVSQRQREIGVRMALGALPRQVLTQFMAVGARLLGWGVLLGALMSFAAARAAASIFFGVSGFDAGVFGAAGMVIAAVVSVAVMVPAWRASLIAPTEALRD